MADVYIGRHTTLDRPMAVKILHSHMTMDPELRRRFEEEAKAVSALRHPNIVQVNDFDVFEDRPYILMELLEGMSLGQFLRELHSIGNSLPFETISRLISGIAAALDYAHARDIVHRDVKPANIVLRKGRDPLRAGLPLGEDVQPILTDFGVARIATAATRTASGTVLGTPAYMSPEQVQGLVVDARSDIYSLGIILYEMLAGKLPFDPESDTPASILYKHVHEDPPALPNITPQLAAVVQKSLEKDKAARYQKASQMADALQSAVRGAPPTAISEASTAREEATTTPELTTPSPTDVERPALRPVLLVAGIGLASVVLIGGVILGGRLVTGDGEPPDPAPVQTEAAASLPADLPILEGEPTQDLLATAQEPTTPPEQSIAIGSAVIRDNSLELRIPQVGPPPAGSAYHAWMLGGEGDEPLNLARDGSVGYVGGELVVIYAHPEGINLAARYQRFVVSLEEEGSLLQEPAAIVFEGELPPQSVDLVQLADEVQRGAPILANLTGWLTLQITHFDTHSAFAMDGIARNDLPYIKQHTEHSLNILEGMEGELYGDWDGNERAENPGDDVGLLPYVRLLLLAAEGSSRAEIQRGGSGEFAAGIANRSSEIVQQLLGLRETVKQILLVDTMTDIPALGLDDQLEVGRGVKGLIDQLAADSAPLDLAIVIEVFPAP
jgi:tRNA A-37 threonylcarbamoyl transferase component Bud32